MSIYEIVLRVFAVYYLANAAVEVAVYVVGRQATDLDDVPLRFRFLADKPFSCVLCQCFWMSLVLFFIPLPWIAIPALAGMAVLLDKAARRLEVFVS